MERAAKERLIGAVVLVTAAWLLIPVFLDQRPAREEDLVSRDLSLPERDSASDAAPAMRRETINLRDTTTPARDDVAQESAMGALPAPEAAIDGVQPAAAKPVRDAEDSVAGAQDDAVTDSGVAVTEETSGATGDASDGADEPPLPETNASAAAQAPAAATPSPPASKPKAASGQLWAVQLGSFSDETNAQKLAATYRAEGLLAFVSEVQSGGRTLHRVRIGPQATRAESEAVVARLKAQGQTAGVVAHP